MYYFGNIDDGYIYETAKGEKFTLGQLVDRLYHNDEKMGIVTIYDDMGAKCGSLNLDNRTDVERLVFTAFEKLYYEGES